ncbi:MAG: chemotaxis protein CheW [Nitrospinaceae bacterium]
MSEPKQFCTFYINDTLLGIEVAAVQEVLKYQEVTKIPLAASEIQGLINLRGQIITAINLRSRMNLPPCKNDRQSMNVITRINNEVVSFLVDSVGDVLEVEDKSFEPVPSTVDAATRDLVSGVYKLDGKRLLMVLDTIKAANVSTSEGQASS